MGEFKFAYFLFRVFEAFETCMYICSSAFAFVVQLWSWYNRIALVGVLGEIHRYCWEVVKLLLLLSHI